MTIPFPGTPVRGSKTGKPLMALLDLIGRPWALGIIWNLSQTNLPFRELQRRCEQISPTMLNARLKELQQTQLVEKSLDGYKLTQLGSELFSVVKPLGAWSTKWSEQLREVNTTSGGKHD